MSKSLASDKYITFKIGTYLLALPIDSVFKVAITPPELSQALRDTKLAQMGQRTVMMLNLFSLLDPNYSARQNETSHTRNFLIIAQGIQEELYGILVDAPPNLVKIPDTCIQPIPNSFHDIGLPTWASQIAILNHKDKSSTILMLDIHSTFASKTCANSLRTPTSSGFKEFTPLNPPLVRGEIGDP